MMERGDFTFYDLRRKEKSKSIELLFPDWREGEERVAIFSPHDDDGILGPGYLLQAIPLWGGEVQVIIFCNGSGGYSVIEHKNIITALRARETVLAYAHLGVGEERIHRLDYDDYSVWPFLGWKLPGGEEGTFQKILPLLRRLKITRVLVPNGYREHLDHYATFLVGAFDTPQVGDPVMADWGMAKGVKSVLQYAVWSDFSPEYTLLEKDALNMRANRALCAPREAEEKINLAMSEFKTQSQIIAGLLEQRKERSMGKDMVEVYLSFEPRPRCEYDKYVQRIKEIESKEVKR